MKADQTAGMGIMMNDWFGTDYDVDECHEELYHPSKDATLPGSELRPGGHSPT